MSTTQKLQQRLDHTAFIGFAAGAELDLMAFLAARYFGLKHYAKIYSILFMSLAICSGTAPMLFARVYDVTSNYDLGFYVSAVLFAFGGLLVLALGRYPDEYGSESKQVSASEAIG